MPDSGTPEESPLLVDVKEGVARVTINRPDAGNALSPDVRDELASFFEDASGDLFVRSIVLTGTGERFFCTGADLRRRKGLGQADRPEGAPDRSMGDASRAIRTGWQRLIAAILDCEKPVIASVNGTAAGGGAQLVLACDLVLMSERARLIEAFVRRGIMPDAGGAWLLPRIVGLHRAKEIVFLGDDISADDCERMGIANRVLPPARLKDETANWAERLAHLPTKAIAASKFLLNRSAESDRVTAFREEAWMQELVNGTTDAREGMRSFVERRHPEFKGW